MLRRLLWLGLLLLLVGCSQQEMIEKFTSPAEQTRARNYIDLLRKGQVEVIEKATDPGIAGPNLHGTLLEMAAMMPKGEPTSVTLVGAHRSTSNGVSSVNLTFEYGFSGKWVLTSVAVKQEAAGHAIVGFSVIPQPASLTEQNRFRLDDRTPAQYLMLALAVVLPLLTLYALVACARTRLKGRKWPWILFVLCGFGKLSVNWTTGQWAFMPVAVQLFSASVQSPLYGPWTLAISLPVGAVVFLLRREKLRAPPVES